MKNTILYAIFALLIIACVCTTPERIIEVVKKSFTTETLRLRYQKYIPPALWMFKEKPIFGWGLWSYRNMVYEAQAQQPREFWKGYPNPKPRRAHNEYAEMLAEGGIVLLGLWLWLVGKILIKGGKIRR